MDGPIRPHQRDETQEVSESPEVSWAQAVSDAQAQEESEEVMEVGYAEAAAMAALPRPHCSRTFF